MKAGKVIRNSLLVIVGLVIVILVALQILLRPQVLTGLVNDFAADYVEGQVNFREVRAHVIKSFPYLNIDAHDFSITYPHERYARYDGLVGAAAALGHHDEAVFAATGSLDVNLGREVALGVHLVVHIERSVLAVTEVLLGVGIEHTQAQGLFIFEVGPDLLALLAVDDCSTSVLAEGQDTLHGRLCVAQELQGHVLVIIGSLGVAEDLGHDGFAEQSPLGPRGFPRPGGAGGAGSRHARRVH